MNTNRKGMSRLNYLFKQVKSGLGRLLIFIFALLVADVLWQVFARYVLNTSFSFTEELARFLLIWLSIIGAAYLNAERAHLSMDFLFTRLSEANKRKASIFAELVIFFFALFVMVVGGANLVYTTLYLDQLSGTMQIPLGYVYAVLPVCGLLIMSFSVYHIGNLLNPKFDEKP